MRRTTLIALSVLLAVTAPAGVAAAKASPRARTLTASVDLSAAGPTVPASFLGLSFEAAALPHIARYADEGNLAGLLASLGPGVVRFGGVSVDTQAAWTRSGTIPSWATTAITPSDIDGVGRLVRAVGWRVLLGINVGHFDPNTGADEVSYAQPALGANLLGIELGNEPDGYPQERLRSDPYNFSDYRSQADAYVQAIGKPFPLAGPDVTSPSRADWIAGEAADEHPSLLTAHYYPQTVCRGNVPTVYDLLSSGIRARERRAISRMAELSSLLGLPLRIGETNNVSCSGEAGVSNTFAAALWAVDYLTRAMKAGLAGVNFHDLLSNCLSYSVLCARTSDDLAAGRIVAQPEWYALLLARQLLGDRPVPGGVSPSRPSLSVSAFRSGGGRLHLVIVDDDPRGAKPLVLKLKLPPRFGSGTVMRLTGPGSAATSGVRLGGAAVAGDGSFRPRTLERLGGRPGALSATIYPMSAALLTVSG